MRKLDSGEFMQVREVARYLGINEKKIYFLAKAGKIPCTRVTGKWTFPKKLIDRWIEESASGLVGQPRTLKNARFFWWLAATTRAWESCTIFTQRGRNGRHSSWRPSVAAAG